MAEGPDLPLPILAWVAGEAARVHAISLAARGRWLAGTLHMAKALALDPLATASELLQRLRNAAGRAFPATAPEPTAALFADLDPDRLSESGFDPLMRKRLARIEAFDRARESDLVAMFEKRSLAGGGA